MSHSEREVRGRGGGGGQLTDGQCIGGIPEWGSIGGYTWEEWRSIVSTLSHPQVPRDAEHSILGR